MANVSQSSGGLRRLACALVLMLSLFSLLSLGAACEDDPTDLDHVDAGAEND